MASESPNTWCPGPHLQVGVMLLDVLDQVDLVDGVPLGRVLSEVYVCACMCVCEGGG